MTKPNVLIITPHDLGDFLGCYGIPVTTPNLDGLAADGVRFENHFSTGTVCSPSRGSITTGCYPHTTGLMGLVHRGWSLDADRCPTMARILRGAGYHTNLFGFQHEHYDSSVLGYDHEHAAGGGMAFIENVADSFVQWLADRGDEQQPFFASVGSFDVHRLIGPTHGFTRAAYDSVDPEQVAVPPWLPDIESVRGELADFYGDIQHYDGQIGRILDALDAAGLSENTVVVFTSDHGAAFLHGKATVYDGGTKVPWIMRWPKGLAGGETIGSVTSHVDVLPTLLDLLGIEAPKPMEGVSMAPLIRGEGKAPRQYVYAEKNYTNFYDPSRMVRSTDLKYIKKGLRTCIFDFLIPEIEGCATQFRHPQVFGYYSAKRAAEELYDLAADPGELTNLADDPAYAEALGIMRQTLDSHLVDTDDPFRFLRNDLCMPVDEYAPAMQQMMRRFMASRGSGDPDRG